MATNTEAVYYHTGNIFAQDAMIWATGTPEVIDQVQEEFWGAQILFQETTQGEVSNIHVSFDDGASWRKATDTEFQALETEAKEQINIAAFEDYCEEL